MLSIPAFRTPGGFFSTIHREARDIRRGHLDEVVRRFRQAGQFTLVEFRLAIERGWRNDVNVKTLPREQGRDCIFEVVYCFDPDMTPVDCQWPGRVRDRWENVTISDLQTDLDGENACPQIGNWDESSDDEFWNDEF